MSSSKSPQVISMSPPSPLAMYPYLTPRYASELWEGGQNSVSYWKHFKFQLKISPYLFNLFVMLIHHIVKFQRLWRIFFYDKTKDNAIKYPRSNNFATMTTKVSKIDTVHPFILSYHATKLEIYCLRNLLILLFPFKNYRNSV